MIVGFLAVTMEKTIRVKGKAIHTKGSKKLFKNTVLELLTHTSPRVTLLTYVPFVIILTWLGISYTRLSPAANIALYVAGVFSWSLTEYLLHRFLFHLQKGFGGKIAYLLHGVHHEYPKDYSRLFMPPLPGSIIILSILGFLFLFIDVNALMVMAGMVNGYLIYSILHYRIHAYPPSKRFRRMWYYHTNHHYKDHDSAYGITSKIWDRVFGTLPKEDKRKS
ncbi:MAG TPA: sterol desaturase family protein [Flavobacteriales bacterium]|nr:sterol desaturase family protein [Flavobacteriales bacterium]